MLIFSGFFKRSFFIAFLKSYISEGNFILTTLLALTKSPFLNNLYLNVFELTSIQIGCFLSNLAILQSLPNTAEKNDHS